MNEPYLRPAKQVLTQLPAHISYPESVKIVYETHLSLHVGFGSGVERKGEVRNTPKSHLPLQKVPLNRLKAAARAGLEGLDRLSPTSNQPGISVRNPETSERFLPRTWS